MRHFGFFGPELGLNRLSFRLRFSAPCVESIGKIGFVSRKKFCEGDVTAGCDISIQPCAAVPVPRLPNRSPTKLPAENWVRSVILMFRAAIVSRLAHPSPVCPVILQGDLQAPARRTSPAAAQAPDFSATSPLPKAHPGRP